MVAAGPPADLVGGFCAPFAFVVHCDLLGVPEPAREAVRTLSLARSGRPGATAGEIHDAELALHEVVIVVVHQVRRERGDGVFAELLAAHDCARLTSTELTGLASSLFFDGTSWRPLRSPTRCSVCWAILISYG